MSIFQEPGLHTDTPNPRDPVHLRHCGYKWIVQQTQNGGNPVKPLNQTAYKGLGFKVGPWGVNYHPEEIERDCTVLLGTATGADLVVLNIEYRLTAAEARWIATKMAAFRGPKALICLVGDLVAMKDALKVLLLAGWDIIGETYTNDQENVTPAEAEWQALNAGIPYDRFSHALGMFFGKRNLFITGAQYAQMLQQANAGKRFNLWMVEHGAESNFLELRTQALGPVPIPAPTPDAPKENLFAQYRDHAKADLKAALNTITESKRRGSGGRVYWADKVLNSTPDQLDDLIVDLDKIWPA